MTQKQTIGMIIGVLVLIGVFVFVYRQFATVTTPESVVQQSKTKGPLPPERQPQEEPKTIDDISKAIQDETDADLSALDDEANGEVSDVQTDSDSVNNLGTAYDENSL